VLNKCSTAPLVWPGPVPALQTPTCATSHVLSLACAVPLLPTNSHFIDNPPSFQPIPSSSLRVCGSPWAPWSLSCPSSSSLPRAPLRLGSRLPSTGDISRSRTVIRLLKLQEVGEPARASYPPLRAKGATYAHLPPPGMSWHGIMAHDCSVCLCMVQLQPPRTMQTGGPKPRSPVAR
jgi:hypothetical protein